MPRVFDAIVHSYMTLSYRGLLWRIIKILDQDLNKFGRQIYL